MLNRPYRPDSGPVVRPLRFFRSARRLPVLHALLDGDRFEGRFRDGVHAVDTTGLMRRMVKKTLLKFDGTPLFPERVAEAVPYKLSDAEARLYKEVTDYACEEFNRAEALQNDKRAGTVGFALTILQRRRIRLRKQFIGLSGGDANG